MASRFHAAWDKVFLEKDFDLSQDLHFIDAGEIKAITGEEPRLMAKTDSSKSLAPVFKQHGYFLLPVSSSRYAIVRGHGFHELEQRAQTKQFNSRVEFNLMTISRNTSEMQYLDYSHIAGVIEDVIGRGTLYSSIRGREGSGNFDFNVGSSNIEVKGAQIEVDLGLEGSDCIVLLEAKSKTPEDFIIRQLYYPYRRFANLAPHKTIIPVFFTYEAKTATYNYWIYEFSDLTDYNSIRLLRTCSYSIVQANTISANDIFPVDSVYKDLIPQANDLDKVQELIFMVKEGADNAAAIADHFGFDVRQSSYYREAAEALGFVHLAGNKYYITDSGVHLTSLPKQERNLYFARVINNFELVKIGMDLLKAKGSLKRADLDAVVASHSNLSGTTISRRASSLYAWFKWIALNTGAFTVTTDGVITTAHYSMPHLQQN